jgi:hypothetical protein
LYFIILNLVMHLHLPSRNTEKRDLDFGWAFVLLCKRQGTQRALGNNLCGHSPSASSLIAETNGDCLRQMRHTQLQCLNALVTFPDHMCHIHKTSWKGSSAMIIDEPIIYASEETFLIKNSFKMIMKVK